MTIESIEVSRFPLSMLYLITYVGMMGVLFILDRASAAAIAIFTLSLLVRFAIFFYLIWLRDIYFLGTFFTLKTVFDIR